MATETTSLRERFDDKWQPVPECGCWIWTGVETDCGYGQIAIGGKMKYAHRVSYELNVGPIPAGLCVRHKCDTRLCVNPDHLLLGTDADNRADMARRRRGRRSRVGRPYGVKPAHRQFQAAIGGRGGYIGLFATEEEAAQAAAQRREEIYNS